VPDGKHYYRYSGPLFEGLQVLGLCCVPKPQQHWQPQAIRRHLNLQGPSDPNIIARRYGDSGSTARWTFGYTLALPAIDRVFVEVDTGTSGPQDIAAINTHVVRFLAERLPATWAQLHPVSGPAWRPTPASAADWPPPIDVLKTLPAPSVTEAPQMAKGSNDGCGVFALMALGAAVLLFVFLRGMAPFLPQDPQSGPDSQFDRVSTSGIQSGQEAVAPAPLQESTPFPTNATLCRGGCPTKPDVGCPSPIKGRLMPDGQRWYFEPQHPRYNEFEPNPHAGELWFCVVREAWDAGFVSAPY
jgi:hypothetical protein